MINNLFPFVKLPSNLTRPTKYGDMLLGPDGALYIFGGSQISASYMTMSSLTSQWTGNEGFYAFLLCTAQVCEGKILLCHR